MTLLQQKYQQHTIIDKNVGLVRLTNNPPSLLWDC